MGLKHVPRYTFGYEVPQSYKNVLFDKDDKDVDHFLRKFEEQP